MDENIDVVNIIKMLEVMALLVIYVKAINKLLIEKGICTEKEFDDFCDKVEKDESMRIVKAHLELVWRAAGENGATGI